MEVTNTLNLPRNIEKIYVPDSIDALRVLYDKLKSENISVSISSTGNNWGYGCASPVSNNGVHISLKALNKIIDFESEHGLVTVEPGVTYGMLSDYLISKGDEWIAPVHGGGPDCSVVGNALERGYGLTPNADHFAAVTHLEAILKDGSYYQGNLTKIGQARLDKLFKYGIGPYLDGIFTQSGVGIVTQMTIKLAPKPKYIEMFLFILESNKDLEACVEVIKELKKTIGSTLGGINLVNQERVLSMLIKYPEEKIKSGEILSSAELQELGKTFSIPSWTIVGGMYGEKSMVKVTKKILKKKFRKIKKRSVFYNSSNKKYFRLLSKFFPKVFNLDIKSFVEKMDGVYNILNGRPDRVALNLAYLKNLTKPNHVKLNPTDDNCGLIWYAPLVEMKPAVVSEYCQFIEESCRKFEYNSFITLTTVDDICFDSTIPILFNKDSAKDSKKAIDLYDYLLAEGAKRGFYPYRLNIKTQSELTFDNQFLLPNKVDENRYK